jgi:hypothetical protein
LRRGSSRAVMEHLNDVAKRTPKST